MNNSAVILAAGRGSRLKEHTKEIPKGLLLIQDFRLVERSVRLLKDAGIRNIIIGTGYLAEKYEEFFANDPAVRCAKNHDFMSYGSMHTLYCLRNYITEDFLLLESDLLFEDAALTSLLKNNSANSILVSGFTKSGDECFVENDAENHLVNISKDPARLSRVDGEFVGISKLSTSAMNNMCDFWKKLMPSGEKTEYETAMVGISQITKINVQKMENLVWCEIDDENHLARAQNLILPKLIIKK